MNRPLNTTNSSSIKIPVHEILRLLSKFFAWPCFIPALPYPAAKPDPGESSGTPPLANQPDSVNADSRPNRIQFLEAIKKIGEMPTAPTISALCKAYAHTGRYEGGGRHLYKIY
ncbi:MAG: hypothetical protein WKI04_14280 [Ferruginibacter sp.]